MRTPPLVAPLVALLDGPLDGLSPQAGASAPAASPAARHAAAMAAAIRVHAGDARVIGFTVFDGRLAASAARVAGALAEAADAGPAVILCALGLARPDPAILAAVARALETGACVVAAAPARGAPVWPAAAPGVVAAQGDARCGPDECSLLAPPQAPGGLRFGARPVLDGWPDVAGASVAAARVAGLLAALRSGGMARAQAESALQATARFFGPERRTRPST